jgi:hypothetical protein
VSATLRAVTEWDTSSSAATTSSAPPTAVWEFCAHCGEELYSGFQFSGSPCCDDCCGDHDECGSQSQLGSKFECDTDFFCSTPENWHYCGKCGCDIDSDDPRRVPCCDFCRPDAGYMDPGCCADYNSSGFDSEYSDASGYDSDNY